MRISGRLIGLFTFDIGYEIRLGEVRRLASEAAAGGLEKRRAAPVHLAYAVAPLRLPLGDRPLRLPDGQEATAAASAWVHEFGAATILLECALDCEVAALPALTGGLTGTPSFEDAARAALAVPPATPPAPPPPAPPPSGRRKRQTPAALRPTAHKSTTEP